jgi:hypothetical protein
LLEALEFVGLNFRLEPRLDVQLGHCQQVLEPVRWSRLSVRKIISSAMLRTSIRTTYTDSKPGTATAERFIRPILIWSGLCGEETMSPCCPP